MSATFFLTLVVAIIAIVYWRVTLTILLAVVLTLLAMGISSFSGAVAGQEQTPVTGAPPGPDPTDDGAPDRPGFPIPNGDDGGAPQRTEPTR